MMLPLPVPNDRPRGLRLALCSLALLLAAPWVSAEIRLLEQEPTVLFAADEPLRQVGWATVENTGAEPIEAAFTVSLGDGQISAADTRMLPPGVSRQEFLVPDRARAVDVTLVIDAGVHGTTSLRRTWEPQRKWKVFIVKSSHEDIGYEDFLWVKQREIAAFMEVARRLAEEAVEDDPDGEIGYRYWLETLLFPRFYAEERSEEALRELVEHAVKPGLLPLAGAPSGIHTHWMDYETLARSAYPARRDYRDRFGLDIDTVAIVDNPSLSWSAVQAYADAGFRYAVRFGQSWRSGGNNDYATTGVPPVFWWEGPDGASRMLFAWRSHYRTHFWYGQSDRAFADLDGLGAVSVNEELQAIQSGGKLGPYVWDALLVPNYRDHEAPFWDGRALREWRARYRYPEIRIADPREFMVYMESHHGNALPVLRGDLNNFSADYATIAPAAHAQVRRASRLLPMAEGWAAIAALKEPGYAPPAGAVDRAYTRLFDYTEHSWPTKPPPGPIHQFNAQWGKIMEGGRALDDAERLSDHAWSALGGQIPTGPREELVVFNPLAHPRNGPVFSNDPVPVLVNELEGHPIPAQTLTDGRTAVWVETVPAFGYRAFRAADQRSGMAGREMPQAPDLRVEDDLIENQFYTIRFDADSGAISSIVDRRRGRELVDATAPYQFNQLVWTHTEETSPTGHRYAPTNGAELRPHLGPVAAEMVSTLRDARLGGAEILQTVRLYRETDRIDVVNQLRHVGVLASGRAEDRYRGNLFYAFPLHVPDFTARAEYPGGVVRPHQDQLRWGSHDFLSVNRWVDVSGADGGVTMAPHGAPIVHFGEIRYNRFATDYVPRQSHLYSHFWSNRMDGLATFGADDMEAVVAYSFRAHAGDSEAGQRSTFGWQVASPLEARLVPARQRGGLPSGVASFLALDDPGVQLTVVKEATPPQTGWIVRLVETQGRATNTEMRLMHLPFTAATRCDLVESDLEPLEMRNDRVEVSLKPYGYVTVRLHTDRDPLPAPRDLRAHAVSDAAIELSWQPVTGAVAYAIYRTVDPQTPPSGHTFLGRASGPAFQDEGLSLGTTYHYQVVAVGPGNATGLVAKGRAATTLVDNRTAPAPVKDLGFVRFSDGTIMLCWAKSIEPDVARYLIFRGEMVDFDPAELDPIGHVSPSGDYLERFSDIPATNSGSVYYRVLAEDWAGNRQTLSDVVSFQRVSPSAVSDRLAK